LRRSGFGNETGEEPSSGEAAPFTLRAVVPFLDEEEHLPAALARLRSGGVDTLVAVDGGSTDRSPELARRRADTVLQSGRGLAAQLNLGARDGHEEAILFAYADIELPSDFRTIIERTLLRPGVVAGAFSLRLAGRDPGHGRLRRTLIAAGANLRTRCGIGPFGDQGIFVRRRAFAAIGGYRAEPILEDLDLVRRLRRLGSLEVSRQPVLASARRWERDGYLRTTLLHARVLTLHLRGRSRPTGGSCPFEGARRGGR